MPRITDDRLETLLRDCGTELRLRSEDHARGEGAALRDEAIARAVRNVTPPEPKPAFGEILRAWLVPAQLGFACVLLLAVVFSLRSKSADPAGPVTVSGGAVVRASAEGYEPSDTDLAAIEVDEAYANVFPDYEPLAMGSPDDLQLEDNDDEDEEFADS